MQDRLHEIEDPIIVPARLQTEFLVSCYHTPSETVRRIFSVVLRAGHLRAAPDYRIERRHLPGHDLLYCLSGSGFILSANRRYQVRQGELAWISGYHPHAHWAHPDSPWELLWIRTDGSQLEQAWNILSGDRAPVFSGLNRERIVRPLQRILGLMTQRPLAIDALLNAQVAEILSQLFEARQAETAESLRHLPVVSSELKTALTRMALYPDRPWRVADLARLSGLSEPHFYRRFKLVTGSSPIDWLRRERINHARRRLLESADSIKQISEQVGYNDPFFFSRDFKRYTGVSPSEYRKQQVPGLRPSARF
jgi:AraC-like DNA-binding protein/quercetin dioxygenase-like cupin family protein